MKLILLSWFCSIDWVYFLGFDIHCKQVSSITRKAFKLNGYIFFLILLVFWWPKRKKIKLLYKSNQVVNVEKIGPNYCYYVFFTREPCIRQMLKLISKVIVVDRKAIALIIAIWCTNITKKLVSLPW